ncbi:MAG: DUF6457 domain-containing protein [Actinobacteria bacterium]|nr:DUF6457 domain-containing protein [Actinomycetota bacterium]
MTVEWPNLYGQALERTAQATLSLTDDEARRVLDLARVVAHGSERRYAPLAAYLAGKFVGERSSAGVAPAEALEDAFATAEALLAGGTAE